MFVNASNNHGCWCFHSDGGSASLLTTRRESKAIFSQIKHVPFIQISFPFCCRRISSVQKHDSSSLTSVGLTFTNFRVYSARVSLCSQKSSNSKLLIGKTASATLLSACPKTTVMFTSMPRLSPLIVHPSSRVTH